MKINFSNLNKYLFLIGASTGIFNAPSAQSQSRPENFILGTYEALNPVLTYSIMGFGPNSGTNFHTTRFYNLAFGSTDELTPGFNRIVKLFEVGDKTFTVDKTDSGELPFAKVVVNRYGVSPIIKTTALFEVATAPSNADSSTIYLRPDYINTMESLINSYVINRGTDNVFTRSSASSTTNNITRIDLILDEPVIIPSTMYEREESGFLLMERGGNDNITVAAITGVDFSDTTVTTFGSVLPVASSNWGSTGQTIQTVVMQKLEADSALRPSQVIPLQPISGVFISLESLGIAPGSIIYGLSLMANSVTDPTTFDPETLEANGGLDFMAGGGFFTRAYLIKGQVWVDANGNAEIDGSSETHINNGIWANLVDELGNVVSSINVLSSDGTFTLFIAKTALIPGTEYKVILTNSEKAVGSTLTESDALLNDYQHTGTNFDGAADLTNRSGIINIGEIISDVENINFGINHPPAAESKSFNVPYTAFSDVPPAGFPDLVGYHSISMASAELTGYSTGSTLSGIDYEDCDMSTPCHSGATYKIISINGNTKLYYDYLDGSGPIEIVPTSEPVTIINFDFNNLVIYVQHGTGTIDSPVEFEYSLVDNAGFISDPAPYTIISDFILNQSNIDINVEILNENPLIKWQIKSSNNDLKFVIERSFDQNQWLNIGSADAIANTTEYNFIDMTAATGYNYYRIISKNGTKNEYSPIAYVYKDQTNTYTLYPNPTSGVLNIKGNKEIQKAIVYNMTGQIIFNGPIINNSIDAVNWSTGEYIIKIITIDGETIDLKFLVID